ncbi:MAG: PilZ domain-containing protein [Chloroflexi bacterium]|nr:PilZ domain-containing protein [Chloroflexota bacterium]
MLRERRTRDRIDCTYPAIIRWFDSTSRRVQEQGILLNMSAVGFYLRLKQQIEPGVRLFVFCALAMTPQSNETLKLASRGIVVRTEAYPDGTYGLGIKIDRSRFV